MTTLTQTENARSKAAEKFSVTVRTAGHLPLTLYGTVVPLLGLDGAPEDPRTSGGRLEIRYTPTSVITQYAADVPSLDDAVQTVASCALNWASEKGTP